VLALRWTERAVAHLEGIVDYVALTSPVYADAMLLRIEHRLALAQAHPYLGKVPRETTDLSIRELVVAPYRVFYRVRADALEVLAIVHGRQDIDGSR
jgi:toxin ParE1/3/4